MQCPACNKESDPSAYGEPAKCPECGVFYEKALALKQRRLAAEEAAAEAAKPKPSVASKLAEGWQGAKVSVEEGRRQREAEQQRNMASRDAAAARPVVVVDISMSFWSMVVFMVKWVLASIPAVLILAVLLSVIGGSAYTLFSGVGSYISYKERFEASKDADQISADKQISVPVSDGVKYFEAGMSQSENFAVMTVRSVAESGVEGYSRIAVDCKSSFAVATPQLKTLESLNSYVMPTNYQPITAGTVRQYIAIRACSGMPKVHPALQ